MTTATATATNGNGTTKVLADESRIVKVPLAKLYVPYDWNSRHEAHITRAGAEPIVSTEGRGTLLAGLIASLMATKQLDPIDVRPASKKGFEYSVITGFRRVMALQAIADKGGKLAADPEWNPVTPYVRAIVHADLSEKQARELNIIENCKDDVTPADLAWGLWEFTERGKAPITQEELASKFNITQGWASRLTAIMRDVDPKITADWRVNSSQLDADVMHKLTKVEKAQQWDAYKKALSTKAAKADGKKDPNAAKAAKLQSRVEAARQTGMLIGRLKVRKFDFEDPNFEAFVETIVGRDEYRKYDVATCHAVASAMLYGFQSVTNPEALDEGEEEIEEES
jgi:ParB-like chromosome segregation protein Spo0J